MAKVVEAWTAWKFEGFGYELSELLRELIMLTFPQKYYVDASGRLQKYTQIESAAKREIARSFSGPVMIIGGAAGTFLVGLAAVRSRRSVTRVLPAHDIPPPLMSGIEGGDAENVE